MAVRKKAWRNGELIPYEEATVHLMSHSLTRGSAIFEVLGVYLTAEGPAAFRLADHADRLIKSAELLDMQLTQSKEEIMQAVVDTVKANKVVQGYVKIVGFFGKETFTVTFSDPRLELSVFAFTEEEYKPKDSPKMISACLSKWRRLHPETVPVEAKVAANYLNGMLVRLDAQRRGFDLGIMLDTHGFVAEGSVESVFLIKDGTLLTPPLGRILSSITRRSILEAAPYAGIKVLERPIRPTELFEAEEIFISSTSRRVTPIYRIEDHPLGEVPGPITSKIANLISAICAGKEERFKNWLYPIR